MEKKYVYVIPDMCCHRRSSGNHESHECITILNTSDEAVEVKFTAYSTDQDPISLETRVCPARRSIQVVPTAMDKRDANGRPLVNSLKDAEGNMIPKGRPYSLLLECSGPVYCQYSRITTAQPEYAMFSVICPQIRP